MAAQSPTVAARNEAQAAVELLGAASRPTDDRLRARQHERAKEHLRRALTILDADNALG